MKIYENFVISEDDAYPLNLVIQYSIQSLATQKQSIMAGLNNNPEAVRKLLENLQSDLKNISLETKKKHPSVKESAEEAIVKIRNASGASSNTPLAYLSNQILYPLVQVLF